MRRGHGLSALLVHHLSVGHDRHLGGHCSEPLHGDHAVGDVVGCHYRDSAGRCHWDQAWVLHVTL